MDTEWIQNGHRTDREWEWNGYEMDAEQVQNGNGIACRTETEHVSSSASC